MNFSSEISIFLNETNEKNFSSSPAIQKLIEAVTFFNFYYMPAMIVIGLIGNILSSFVFMLTKLRSIPSSHYLTALAISDSGVLFGQLCVRFQIGFDSPHSMFCKIFYYFYYSFTLLLFKFSNFFILKFSNFRPNHFIPRVTFKICLVKMYRG